MNITVTTYITYLAVSIALTVWVAHTLFKNGQVFLNDVFHGNDALAKSVNHLLVVGFYLVNLGFITKALRIRYPVDSTQVGIEALANKIGTVLMVLGAMHFCNLYVFSRMRRRTVLTEALPPVGPDACTPVEPAAAHA